MAAWQFKAIAKSSIPDTDQLAMFFGTFNMVAGVASLLLQLLLTGRALRKGGVGLTLFIVPVALSAVFAAPSMVEMFSTNDSFGAFRSSTVSGT